MLTTIVQGWQFRKKSFLEIWQLIWRTFLLWASRFPLGVWVHSALLLEFTWTKGQRVLMYTLETDCSSCVQVQVPGVHAHYNKNGNA
jgi:hypothetical protein